VDPGEWFSGGQPVQGIDEAIEFAGLESAPAQRPPQFTVRIPIEFVPAIG
jgi:hypothetical protein